MGFFSRKKKVQIETVASDLAASIMRATTVDLLRESLSDYIDRDQIGSEQASEFLILKMFAVTRVISGKLDSKAQSKRLLDRFHESIYIGKFGSDHQVGAAFEGVVQERYTKYFEILSDPEFAYQDIGRFLAEKMGSEDDAAVQFYFASLFGHEQQALAEYVDQLNQFELV